MILKVLNHIYEVIYRTLRRMILQDPERHLPCQPLLRRRIFNAGPINGGRNKTGSKMLEIKAGIGGISESVEPI